MDTTGFNFKPLFQTWFQSWGLSSLQIPSLTQFSYATSLHHQQHFLNWLHHQRSSSKTDMMLQTHLFLKFTTHDETYVRRLLVPLHMEITLISDFHTISLNKICNKYNIYKYYSRIYKQRKWQMRRKKKEEKEEDTKRKVNTLLWIQMKTWKLYMCLYLYHAMNAFYS